MAALGATVHDLRRRYTSYIYIWKIKIWLYNTGFSKSGKVLDVCLIDSISMNIGKRESILTRLLTINLLLPNPKHQLPVNLLLLLKALCLKVGIKERRKCKAIRPQKAIADIWIDPNKASNGSLLLEKA